MEDAQKEKKSNDLQWAYLNWREVRKAENLRIYIEYFLLNLKYTRTWHILF